MPLLPCLTNSGPSTSLFGLKGATGNLPGLSTLNVSSINVATSEIGLGNGEYISTIGNQLFYYNGTVLEPISALSSISTIEDWAIYPAISTIDADLQNVDNVSSLAANEVLTANLLAANGFVSSFAANNATVSSLVALDISTISLTAISTIHVISTISSANVEAVLGEFSTLVAGNAILNSTLDFLPDPSTIVFHEALPSTYTISQQVNGLIGNQIILDVSGGISLASNKIVRVPNILSTPSLYVSSINGAEFTSTTITVELGQFSSIATQSISSLGAEIRQALMSTIVFSPSLNPSLGGVNVNMGLGGLLGNVVGWGAGVFGAAAGAIGLVTGITALAMGRQTQQINNTYFEMVNGTSQLQFSTLNVPFSTIYRFNNSANPQAIPGEEIFVSTIHGPGIAVRTLSDPIYTLSTPSSTIQAFGQWVPVPEANPSSISTVQDWALFPALSTIAFDVGVPAVVQSGNVNTDNILIAGSNITLVGNYTDAKDLLLVSTVSTAVIQGANPNLFNIFTSTPGLKIEAPNLFLSTPVVVHPGFFNGSSISVNSGFARDLSVSTLTASTLQVPLISTNTILGTAPGGQQFLNLNSDNVAISAAQLYLGNTTVNIQTLSPNTLNAQFVNVSQFVSTPYIFVNQAISSTAISTGNLTASAINILGPSSIAFNTAGSAGAQTQPLGRLVITGNDVDLGQQDLWCQQIRLGAGNATNAQTEIVFYDANANQRGLQTALLDRTIRVVSTINGTTGGYMLDTNINPPFFSTINQSTALMAFFPSTVNSTIGVSTISFVPPLTVAGSFYSSTSQTVAGANTETPLTYNSQSVNVGGFTFAGSTITVPVAGLYEVTHSIQFDTTSGGTNEAYFWLKKNGTTIAQSGSIVSIVNNGETLGTIALLDQAAAGDQYAVSIQSADTNMTAAAVAAAGNIPGIPSIITNIKRVT